MIREAHEAFSMQCGAVLARAVVSRTRVFMGELVVVEPSAGVMREPIGVTPRWVRPPDMWQQARLTPLWREKALARIAHLFEAWTPV